ncbi:MAG: AbrB family transcriptional regulator [Bacillota bacterium]
MALFLLKDLVLLFILGCCGWVIFKFLRLPAAPLLGTITLIGLLRIMEVPLPTSPGFLSPLIQIFLGLYIGSTINKETVQSLKVMMIPSVIVVAWSLGVAFVLGALLSKISFLDLYTGILASSMGGLPEMTVIALATGADVEVVIVMQMFRLISVIIAFPIILKYIVSGGNDKEKHKMAKHLIDIQGNNQSVISEKLRLILGRLHDLENGAREYLCKMSLKTCILNLWGVSKGLTLAAIGGTLFYNLGVPAGAVVGSMFFVGSASLLGLRISTPHKNAFGVMLVGIGVMVSDNISPHTLEKLFTLEVMKVVLVSTAFVFITSILIAHLIKRITQWDFVTSFLAAAPGGLSVMTMLAVNYGKDPFCVSTLHLYRLIALKAVIPLVFMFLV